MGCWNKVHACMHANLEDLGQLLVVLNNDDISLRVLAHIQTSLCREMRSNIIQCNRSLKTHQDITSKPSMIHTSFVRRVCMEKQTSSQSHGMDDGGYTITQHVQMPVARAPTEIAARSAMNHSGELNPRMQTECPTCTPTLHRTYIQLCRL